MSAVPADTLVVLHALPDHTVHWELEDRHLPVRFMALQGGSTVIQLVEPSNSTAVTTFDSTTDQIRLLVENCFPEIPFTGGLSSSQPSGGRFPTHPRMEFICYSVTAEFYIKFPDSNTFAVVASGVLVHPEQGRPTKYEVLFEEEVSKAEATIILLTFSEWALNWDVFGVRTAQLHAAQGLTHTPTYRGGDTYTSEDSPALTWRGRVQLVRASVDNKPSIVVTDLDGQTASLPIISRTMRDFSIIPDLRSDDELPDFGPHSEFWVRKRGRDFKLFWNQALAAQFEFKSDSGHHKLTFGLDVPDSIALMIFAVATEYFF
ncbi:hypothetical protein DFH09DRAFT_1095549 [Mycena vulgaris]|nr:hypothetical protein DFH09DRAFT_1095549 [Mycena vulgaris]